MLKFSRALSRCWLVYYSEYSGTGVSITDYNDGLVQGHPPGGVAIFWRKRLDCIIKTIDTNCNWCTAVEISALYLTLLF